MVARKKQPTKNDKNNDATGAASTSRTQEHSGDDSTSEDDAPPRLTDAIPRFVEPEYKKDTRVLCQHSDTYYYDAKIVNVGTNDEGENVYSVHYQGWNKRYDEELTHTEATQKFLAFTEENLAIAKRELADARKKPITKSDNKKSEKKPKKEATEQKKPSASQPVIKADRKPEKKAKKEAVREKKTSASQPAVQTESTHKETSNTAADTHQKSSTNEVEDGVEDSNNKVEKTLSPAPPVFAQVTEDQENTILTVILDKILVDDYSLVIRQKKLLKVPGRFTIDDIFTRYFKTSKNPVNSKLKDELDTLVEFFNDMVNKGILYKFEYGQHLKWLNYKRREFGLSDVLMKQFLEHQEEEFCGPQWEEPAEPEEETESSQIAETQNKKPATSKQLYKAKPKKKSPADEEYERENNFNFIDLYGFVQLVRFFYLLKKKTSENEMYSKHAKVINDMVEFLSANSNEYFNVEEDYESATPTYQRQALSQ